MNLCVDESADADIIIFKDGDIVQLEILQIKLKVKIKIDNSISKGICRIIC